MQHLAVGGVDSQLPRGVTASRRPAGLQCRCPPLHDPRWEPRRGMHRVVTCTPPSPCRWCGSPLVSGLSSSHLRKRPIAPDKETILLKQRVIQLGMATLFLLIASSAWTQEANHLQATDDFPSDVASVWFDLLYDVVKTEALSPPVASRIYGIAAVTLYEAIVPGGREHRSLVGQ